MLAVCDIHQYACDITIVLHWKIADIRVRTTDALWLMDILEKFENKAITTTRLSKKTPPKMSSLSHVPEIIFRDATESFSQYSNYVSVIIVQYPGARASYRISWVTFTETWAVTPDLPWSLAVPSLPPPACFNQSAISASNTWRHDQRKTPITYSIADKPRFVIKNLCFCKYGHH